MSLLAGPLALYSERRFRDIPELPHQEILGSLPGLTIIVPARNEANNLERLLPSLNSIKYPGAVELIVVDDNSADQTAAVAKKYGAQVIELTELPEGWTGKTYACHMGALAAENEWLLFTDADTVHHPNGPAQAVAYAIEHGLNGLSIFFKQITSKGLDRLTLLVAFAGLFVSFGSNKPIINGQYILLHSDVYNDSSGFASVALESMEDLALGQHLRKRDYQVPLIRSETVAAVQMYNQTSDLWQGLMRLGSGSLSWLGLRSILTALFITGAMTPILILISTFILRRNRKWAGISWSVIAASFLPWASRFGSPGLALLAPFGALLILLAAVIGILRRVFGRGIHWKGRKV